MSRSLGLVLVVLLLTPALAGEEPAPGLAARDFALLPINDLEKGELQRDHPALAREIALLARRAAKLRKLLDSRKNQHDDGSRKIDAQILEVESRLEPLMRKVVEATRQHGVSDELLGHIAAAARGPERVARYAIGLPLYVDGLTARQRELFETVVPRLDGAVLALAAEKERLAGRLKQSGLSETQATSVLSNLAQRIRQIEKRYWRLVDYVVSEAQRASMHRLLPNGYQKQESIIEHIYALPGLTPSQGTRIRALLTEIEAESAPESAAVRRLEARLRDKALAAADRRASEQELTSTRLRQLELLRHAVLRAKEVLSSAQWVALEAIPPRVSIGDRKRNSVQLLEGIPLTSTQRAAFAGMRSELDEPRRLFKEKRLAAAVRMSQYGPDSPQMEGMRMEMAGVLAQGNSIQRAFNGRILLELLTPEQVFAWILGGT